MQPIKTLLPLVMILFLAGASTARNAYWRTLLSMWQDCAEKSPNKSRTHNNLGNCYILLEQYFPAIAEYQKAVKLQPGNMEAQYNLAKALDTVGLYNQAMQPYDIFCRFAPPVFEIHRKQACDRLRELLVEAGRRN